MYIILWTTTKTTAFKLQPCNETIVLNKTKTTTTTTTNKKTKTKNKKQKTKTKQKQKTKQNKTKTKQKQKTKNKQTNKQQQQQQQKGNLKMPQHIDQLLIIYSLQARRAIACDLFVRCVSLMPLKSRWTWFNSFIQENFALGCYMPQNLTIIILS